MFIGNSFTRRYYSFIQKIQQRDNTPNRRYFKHHIVPRSFGGSDEDDNLVMLSFKEHKYAHWLLIQMTEGIMQYKMQYAYKFFDSNYPVLPPGWSKESHQKGVDTRKRKGSYKRGNENIFSTETLRLKVSERMKTNNPMKQEHQRIRMSENNPRNKAIRTPEGTFISRAAALRHHGFKHWKVLYNLMEKYPQEYYWV